jgi:MFS family permease
MTGGRRQLRPPTSGRRPYYGWVLVGTLAGTETVSYGVLTYSFAVFLLPMHQELGWSRAAISGAYALALLIAGLAAVPVGRWLDRHGPRGLMTLGSILATLLVFAWAGVHTLAGFYLIWAGIGVAMAAVLYEPAFATITAWFTHERDRALLALTVVAGFASTIFVPLAQWLIGASGWRRALLVLAVLLGTLTIAPHALLLRHRPEAFGLRPDGGNPATPVAPGTSAHNGVPARVALRQATFWWLAAAFTLATLGISVLGVHLVAALIEQGHSPRSAAAAAGLLGATAVLGRILVTPASRRWPRPLVTATVFALQAAGVLALLAWREAPGMAVFVLLFGAGRGILSLARATLVADFYGRLQYASINGVLALPLTGATAIAPVIAGVLHTRWGSYTPVLQLVAGTTLLAAVAMLLASAAAGPHATGSSPDRAEVNRPGSAGREQLHDVLDHEAALVAVGEPAERFQQGVRDLERDHAEHLRAGDGKRWRVGHEPVVQQFDADLVDAAAAPRPCRHLVREERPVEVGEGPHAGFLGPLGKVVVVEQPRRRDAPGVLEELAAVVGEQVAVTAGDRGRPAQRAARLLVEESGQEQRVAPEVKRVDQFGQPRVLGERLGRLG